jgi:dolichyl-phosphate-mannose-protein mannosyltransferase
MLIAGIGWLAGFDGSFRFDRIGLEYASGTAPYRFMRLCMAAFGGGAVLLSFGTMVEMGVSPIAAAVATILMAFGTDSINK